MAEPDYPLALPVMQPTYPTLHFFANHGNSVAVGVAASIALAGLIAWFAGLGWVWFLFGLALAVFAYLPLRCLGELVHLIVDTMVPK